METKPIRSIWHVDDRAAHHSGRAKDTGKSGVQRKRIALVSLVLMLLFCNIGCKDRYTVHESEATAVTEIPTPVCEETAPPATEPPMEETTVSDQSPDLSAEELCGVWKLVEILI